MSDTEEGAQISFAELRDRIMEKMKALIGVHLQEKTYQAKDGPAWAHEISEEAVRELQTIDTNFKYAVTCIILNKNEGGLHMSSSCYWNTTTDGNCVIKWENESMYCILNAFGFAHA
jgi:dynein light chain Tctex-type 1